MIGVLHCDHFGRPGERPSVPPLAVILIVAIIRSFCPPRLRSVWPPFDTSRDRLENMKKKGW